IRLGRPGDEGTEMASVAAEDGQTLLQAVRLTTGPTLVMVVAPSTSLAMDRVGDQVTPLVMATARRGHLVGMLGSMHALTSATTLHWLGVPVPSSMDGDPVTFTDAPAPFGLHRLHLEQRRTRLPVALVIVAFIAAVGMAGIAVLLAMAKRGDVAPRVRAAMRF